MTCQELAAFLMDYLDGALPPAQRTAFEEHLGECPDCVAYLATYRETIRLSRAAYGAAPAGIPDELVAAILASRGRT
jgi:anti-sigma factor RsiW